MLFTRADSPHKACPTQNYSIDRTELKGGLKSVLNKTLDVKLKIQPDTLQQHRTWHSHVIRAFDDIFLAVNEVTRAIKMDSSLHTLSVSKHDLKVEGLFVENFDLKQQIRLQQVKIDLTSQTRHHQFCVLVRDVHVALNGFVVCSF